MSPYDVIARGMVPKGDVATVICKRCGKNFPPKIAEYLRDGWPICCGETATLATRRAATVGREQR